MRPLLRWRATTGSAKHHWLARWPEMDLEIVIPAILTFVRERGGFATKTKLLKLLYLVDLEKFRETQSTVTGFKWIFYKYGPWAGEYDDVLEALAHANRIVIKESSGPDYDTQFIDATEKVELGKAFPTVVDELQVRRIIEAWADRPTGELLDYVYFHTAPMLEARRGEPLDFSAVLKEEPAPVYKRTSSGADSGTIARWRRELKQLLSKSPAKPAVSPFTPPKYDIEFWEAIETLERNPD